MRMIDFGRKETPLPGEASTLTVAQALVLGPTMLADVTAAMNRVGERGDKTIFPAIENWKVTYQNLYAAARATEDNRVPADAAWGTWLAEGTVFLQALPAKATLPTLSAGVGIGGLAVAGVVAFLLFGRK